MVGLSQGGKGGGGGEKAGVLCWEGLQLPLVLANRPLAEDLEGGACSDNLYTSGPRPRRISCHTGVYENRGPPKIDPLMV